MRIAQVRTFLFNSTLLYTEVVMGHKFYQCNVGCPVEATLQVIGGKWKGVILYHLLSRTFRFNELRRAMPDITQRMLTKQLRELESDHLISRKIYPEIPPRVEYSITDYGRTLQPIMTALQEWGANHLQTHSANASECAEPTPEKRR